MPSSCKAQAAPNIALIKYWGKDDEDLNIPSNDSISLTLDTTVLCSTCLVKPSSTQTDEFFLNNSPSTVTSRLQRQLTACRPNSEPHFLSIISKNNFPTAAGLASSASGYAATAVALCNYFSCNSDVSVVARLGSGSACRSVHGGLVRWLSSDPFNAEQVLPASDLSNLIVVVIVFSAETKSVSSTEGMRRTQSTSPLFSGRKERAHKRLEEMIDAFKSRDFPTVFRLTMEDSNDLHEMCATSVPPINYLSSSSEKLKTAVHDINNDNGSPLVAYTFDAGCNGFLILERCNLNKVVSHLALTFPDLNNLSHQLLEDSSPPSVLLCIDAEEVRSVYISGVGSGPLVQCEP
ncbi:hypothetical protein RCL1_001648 [Eukaryota sp. TZLM3-RCL]